MAKILIVDDDSLAQVLLIWRLTRDGFQVSSASNGVQAIALARAERPKLILLDVDVPMLSGWQVAQRLRAMPETRAIPIIVLTGPSFSDQSPQFTASGCDAYEPKPVRFPELIAKIRWLSQSGRATGLYTREAGAI